YIPQNDLEFTVFGKNLFALLKAGATTYGISLTRIEAAEQPFLIWIEKDNAWKKPATATHAAKVAKEKAKATAIDAIRSLYRECIQNNTLVDDEARVLMNLNLPNPGPHPHNPPAKTAPVLEVEARGHGQMHISTRDEATPDSKAKPHGQQGVRILLKISATPLQRVEDFKDARQELLTHATTFDYTDHAGEYLYAVGCWQNTTGETGPWGNITGNMIS
ncbi:MAG: hypothetical protein LBK22_05420, partial [Tannerella sp.]|nr:hypothetical protein [Tannerella sp.]